MEIQNNSTDVVLIEGSQEVAYEKSSHEVHLAIDRINIICTGTDEFRVRTKIRSITEITSITDNGVPVAIPATLADLFTLLRGYFISAGGSTPIDNIVQTLPGGTTIAGAVDFRDMVNLGLIGGWSSMSQRARISGIGATFTSVTSIMEPMETYFNNKVWDLAGSAIPAVNFVSDTSGGANATSIYINGISDTGLYQEETIAAPVAPGVVNAANSYSYINTARVNTNGGVTTALGDIDVSIGGVLQARISAGSAKAEIGNIRTPIDIAGCHVVFEYTSLEGDAGQLLSTLTIWPPFTSSANPAPIWFDSNISTGTPKVTPISPLLPPLTTFALFARNAGGGTIQAKGSIDVFLKPL